MIIVRRLLVFLLLATLSGQSQAFFLHHRAGGGGSVAPLASGEEFVGPFPSWTNVKTACGAVGNGSTDDTSAIQTCLNGLSSSAPVLWFPAGNYLISHTLSLVTQQYVSLLGASPSTTAILAGSGFAAASAASFTGSIATTGSGATQVITLTVSGLTGTIVPGQSLKCAGCSPALANPTVIWKSLGGGAYQLATQAGGGVTQSATAMTTVDRSMLWLGGISYSRVNRLTFNGQSNANILIDQSKPDNFANYFDSGNEYADDVFENAGIAFNCGSLDYGCAETAMLRDKFLSDNIAGVQLWNANALDMWVWYSLFSGDGAGLSNIHGSGAFHAYNNVFLNTVTVDATWGNTGPMFTMYGNYSSGSNYCWYGGGTSSFNAVVFQNNVCLNNTSLAANNADSSIVTFANFGSVREADAGPLILLDNTICSLGGATTPIVRSSGDLFSAGNTFTVTPISNAESANTGGGFHSHSFSDTVGAACPNPPQPVLPSVPPNNGRQIYETSSSGSGTTCSAGSPCSVQTAICEASTGSSGFSAGACTGTVSPSSAVVHLLPQSYTMSTTLAVPANADIQIIGDGGYSQLTWSGGSNGTVLQLSGPSKVTLRDFKVNGNAGTASGIVVTNADQSGSLVYGQGLEIDTSTPNLLANHLNNTRVELENIQHFSVPSASTSINVVGGASPAGSITANYANVHFNNYRAYTASSGGQLLAETDWDGGSSNSDLVLGGTSTVTIAGGFGAIASPYATLSGFQGTLALAGIAMNSASATVGITGNGTGGNVLALGLVGNSTSFFSDTTSPTDTNAFLNGQNGSTGSGVALAEVPSSCTGGCVTSVLAALNQMRTTAPVQRLPTSAGVTNVGIYRVIVTGAIKGIDLEH